MILKNTIFETKKYYRAYLIEGIVQTNGAKFELSYNPTTQTRAEIRMKPITQTGDLYLGIPNTISDSADWRLFYTNGRWYFDNGEQRIMFSSSFPSSFVNIEVGNNYLIYVGNRTDGTTNTSAISNLPFQIGPVNFQLEYLKLYEGDELMMDIVGAKAGDSIGFYDKISGQMFLTTNATQPIFIEKE